MTEFDLIARYFDRGPPRHTELGIGDDGALIGPLDQSRAVVCDMLVAGRHFFAHAPADSVGHKALAVNLSDLAAMGARPESFLLALALPQADDAWLADFSRGLFALADRFGCELIGGDTTRGPLTIAITALGSVAASTALRRDRAEPGDDLWLSGEVGAAAAAVQWRLLAIASDRADTGLAPAADAVPVDDTRLAAIDMSVCDSRLDWPEPRVALGQSLRHLARAAIDVSDGLVGDLQHVASRSRVRLVVRAADVPVAAALAAMAPDDALHLALNGGDDYELAFTAAPENRRAIEAIGERLSLRLSRIGEVVAGEGVQVRDARDRPVLLSRQGHDHFATPAARA